MNTVSAKFLSAGAMADQAAIRPVPQSHKVHPSNQAAMNR